MMIKGYITNLGKYNEGELVGEWIEFPIDEEELEEALERIGVSDKPNEDGVYYEEYFFTDWDCSIEGDLGEYVSIEEVNEFAERLEELDDDDEEVIRALMDTQCWTVEEALDIFESNKYEYYKGYSMRGLAEELADEYIDYIISNDASRDFIKRYFDYNQYADELEYDGYEESDNGVIYIY